MKSLFKGVYRTNVILLLCLIFALSLAAGCSKNSGSTDSNSSGGGVQLSGSVGSGYQAVAQMKQGFFAKIFTTLGIIGTPAYAALTDPAVDQVVAIPMERGSLMAFNMKYSVTAAINADKTFSLTLANNRDWLLVLMNSTATGANRFVGSLALNTGSADSLLNIPVTQATVATMDLGVVSRPVSSSSDAISATTVTASDFNLTAGQLSTLAKTDDLFKNAKNIVNNYDSATGIYHEMRTDFHWSGNYGTLATLFSGPAYTSIGVSFQQDTNSTAITMNDLCNGTGIVEFVPSDVISNGVTTFGPTTPLSSKGMTCMPIMVNGSTYQQTSGGGGGNIFATDAFGGLSYGPYGRYTVLPGRWDLKENGVVKAQFDMAAANPPITANGRPKGYVPSFKVNVDGSKKITSVDIKWYYYDEASDSYIAVAPADLKLLEHVIKTMEVGFDVTYQGTRKSCNMYFDPMIVTHADPSDPAYNCPDSWYYNDSSHPATNTGLMGFYETGGFGYFFDFFLP